VKNTRIAMAVVEAKVGRFQENLEKMAFWVERAKDLGAQIVCFPELNVSGYTTQIGRLPRSHPIPGPMTDAIGQMARTNGVAILAGLVESAQQGALFAAHIVAGTDGAISAYRKCHIAPPERQLFQQGSALPLFEAAGLTFGLQLCWDAHFPGLATAMAARGADALFIPHASPRGTAPDKLASWMRHLPARAFDNGVFVAAVNPCGNNGAGLNFAGCAVVIGPDGRVITQKDDGVEGLLVATLKAADLNGVRSHPMRYFLPHRRLDIY
jgi:N-carbamoylputrescine amidase